MKRFMVLLLLFFSGCQDYTNSPFKAFLNKFRPSKSTPKTSHDRIKKAIADLDGDGFSKAINDQMSGPTSNISLSAPYSASPDCNTNQLEESEDISADDLNVTDDDYMNGFPLSFSAKTTRVIKGEPQVRWDECKGMKSHYDDGDQSAKCTERTISKEYITFFDNNFASCVQDASKDHKGNSGDIQSIKFSHAGITGDTSHSSRSYHSVNRAMDIRKITFIKNGRTETLKVSDQKKSPAKEFFNKFRKCWSDKIVGYKKNCPGSTNKGSIGHEDKNHQHHLHLSLPYCPRKHQGTNYYYK